MQKIVGPLDIWKSSRPASLRLLRARVELQDCSRHDAGRGERRIAEADQVHEEIERRLQNADSEKGLLRNIIFFNLQRPQLRIYMNWQMKSLR